MNITTTQSYAIEYSADRTMTKWYPATAYMHGAFGPIREKYSLTTEADSRLALQELREKLGNIFKFRLLKVKKVVEILED